MRYRNTLIAIMLSVISWVAGTEAQAQTDTISPQNNLLMNRYSYLPVAYQRGSSTATLRLYPNPATSHTNIYINSIRQQDRGEMMVYNNTGTVVLRNTVQPGNNNVNVSSLSPGMYIVKVFAKDAMVFTKQLIITQ